MESKKRKLSQPPPLIVVSPEQGQRAGYGMESNIMSQDDDYIYDDISGEWVPASQLAQGQTIAVEVRDGVGNVLADGDQIVLLKDLPVKGAGQTLRRGTVIKSIRLTGDPQEIDCKYEGIKGLVLRAEFVRKR